MTGTINTPSDTDLLSRINTRLKANPAWRELFAATTRLINERVTRPRNQLATVRDPRLFHRGDWTTVSDGRRVIINHIAANDSGLTVYAQVQGTDDNIEFTIPFNTKDRPVLVQGCAFHGFSYFSGTLTDADYARIMEWVEIYWPESGTENFVRFMGFIKNMRLDIDQLFSDETVIPFESERTTHDGVHFTNTGFTDTENDYYPYLEAEAATDKTWENGKSYLTSHVQLRYDAILTPNPDFVDLFYLFYYLAPIHLVLERIVAEIVSPPVIVDQTPPFATISMTDMGVFVFEPDTEIFSKVAPAMAPIVMTDMAVLLLDDDFVQEGLPL